MIENFQCHCGNNTCETFSQHDIGHYNKCKHCQTLRYGPYPSQDEINQFYTNYAAYKSGLTEYLSGSDYDIFIATKKLTMLDLDTPLTFFNNKKYLDIGCGTGHWLRYLSTNGLVNGYGIDTSPECVKLGQDFGVTIRQVDLLDINETFDILFMSHLIEHVLDPVAYIVHCASILNPGGALIIETPVYGPVAEAYRENWRFLMPIEHLNLFSAMAIKTLLANHGFQMVKEVSFGSGINSMDGNKHDKQAMDQMVKKLNIGDTYAGYYKKL